MKVLIAGAAVITLIATVPSLGASQDVAITRLENSVQTQKKRFAKQAETARAAFVAAFGNQIGQIRRLSDVSPSVKQQRIQRLVTEREDFAQKGRLPESDEMLWATIRYVDTLRINSVSLRNIYDLLASRFAKSGNLAASRKITAEKRAILDPLVLRTPLEQGQAWHGSRHFEKSNSDFHLWIEELEGGLLQGKIKSNRGWTEMKVSGSIDGNQIVMETTAIVQGKHRWLKFNGYYFDNRMVLWTDGITIDKKRANDYVILRHR